MLKFLRLLESPPCICAGPRNRGETGPNERLANSWSLKSDVTSVATGNTKCKGDIIAHIKKVSFVVFEIEPGICIFTNSPLDGCNTERYC